MSGVFSGFRFRVGVGVTCGVLARHARISRSSLARPTKALKGRGRLPTATIGNGAGPRDGEDRGADTGGSGALNLARARVSSRSRRKMEVVSSAGSAAISRHSSSRNCR